MFYNAFELKMMEINFKRLNCSLLADRTCYFEIDLTDDLRSWLKQFNIEINEDEPKIHCSFYQDGTIGHVFYSLRYFTKFIFERSDISEMISCVKYTYLFY